MQNDYHDDFEGQEGSEYHFSDDDINYEGEETASKVEESPSATTPTPDLKSRLMSSKRLLISGGVFLVLIFVVYKMVAPTSTAPVTEIAPTTISNAPKATVPENQGVVAVKTPNINLQTQNPEMTTQPVANNQPVVAMQPTVPVAQPVVTQPAAIPPVTIQQVATQPVATQPVMTQPATTVPMTTSPVLQPVTPGTVATSTNMQPYQQISTAPTTPNPSYVATDLTNQTPSLVITNSNTDEKLAQLKASNERLIGQLEGQYAQQYNDFSNQTRAIQEQMQSLNARVSTIEGQLNQLIQALTKKNAATQQTGTMDTTAVVPRPTPASPNIKVAYNVQAIIPGRAWLKSDNGETLTVAEGDSIKGIGKVTKIDPYDGVVELNTGTRSISLSYGENA